MPVPKLTQSVVDARVTLQRLQDAKIIHGWVVAFDSSIFVVRLNQANSLPPGSAFACRVSRQGGDLVFQAVTTGSLGNVQNFEIEGQISMLSSAGDPRYSRDIEATANEFPVKVVDASPRGVGIVSSYTFRVGERVDVEIGNLMVRGEVRYCRPIRTGEGGYRVGIQLNEMGRIDRARWSEIVYGPTADAEAPVTSRLAA